MLRRQRGGSMEHVGKIAARQSGLRGYATKVNAWVWPYQFPLARACRLRAMSKSVDLSREGPRLLAQERAAASFRVEWITNMLDGGPEKTEWKRRACKIFISVASSCPETFADQGVWCAMTLRWTTATFPSWGARKRLHVLWNSRLCWSGICSRERSPIQWRGNITAGWLTWPAKSFCTWLQSRVSSSSPFERSGERDIKKGRAGYLRLQ